MTETPDTPAETTPDGSVEPGTPTDDQPDLEDTDDADDRDHFPRDYVNKLRAENKRLREGRTAAETGRTAAETERHIERARNEIRDQREVERIAAEVLIDGTDIWRENIDIGELRDEDGLPDHGKIRAYANTVGQLHRHLRKPATPAASTVTGDASPYDTPSQANWSEFLRGGAGG